MQDQASTQDHLEHDILPLDNLPLDDDINQEPQDAASRRNPPRGKQQQQRQQPERPDQEDILTQLTQEILTMRRELANQSQQPRHDDISEDPNFNWVLLKLPPETKFTLPGTGVV